MLTTALESSHSLMSILAQAHSFVESLRRLSGRTATSWRQCPHCGSGNTIRHGSYTRRPFTREGRVVVPVQRHRCRDCQRTYSEQSPDLVPRSWYSREVHRQAVDLWVHLRTSMRRAAEWLRSEIGHQERFSFWQAVRQEEAQREPCYLAASTVCRWLNKAGIVAQASVPRQLEGIACSGKLGVDGLWAKLRKGAKRVLLMLTDSVSGLVYPLVVATGEGYEAWESLFGRAIQAGLPLGEVQGITSDGAAGLASWIESHLPGVCQQRCVWHLWRGFGSSFGRLGEQAREELQVLVHAVLDASSHEAAEEALGRLRVQRGGGKLWRELEELHEKSLAHLLPGMEGLIRVGPEWQWRDFRLRLSRGRNHGSPLRLERAGLVWGIYHNFTPAQWRSERKRRYKNPGRSPLEVAGSDPDPLSYLDALQV